MEAGKTFTGPPSIPRSQINTRYVDTVNNIVYLRVKQTRR